MAALRAPGARAAGSRSMLRYLVALLLVAFAMLAVRRLLRARDGGGAPGKPAATWPWLLVPIVVAALLIVGFAYRNWALER